MESEEPRTGSRSIASFNPPGMYAPSRVAANCALNNPKYVLAPGGNGCGAVGMVVMVTEGRAVRRTVRW